MASTATLLSAATPVEYDHVTVLHVSVVVTPCKRKKLHNVPTMNNPDCVLPEPTVENPYKKQSTSSNLARTTTTTGTLYAKKNVSIASHPGGHKIKKKKFKRECRFHIRLTRENIEVIGFDVWPNGMTDAFCKIPLLMILHFLQNSGVQTTD